MQRRSVEEAVTEIIDAKGTPRQRVITAECPHCGAYCQMQVGAVETMANRQGDSGQTLILSYAFVFAECIGCKQSSILFRDHLLYPTGKSAAPPPHEDMPEEALQEYREAAEIVGVSPRAAAALLRLAVQKLCPVLGATKGNIDQAIGELVKSGTITSDIQRALDVLRVIGNESVHPGQINLNDDRKTAAALFSILNFIVERAITERKRIDEIYGMLPPEKLEGIVRRDGA